MVNGGSRCCTLSGLNLLRGGWIGINRGAFAFRRFLLDKRRALLRLMLQHVVFERPRCFNKCLAIAAAQALFVTLSVQLKFVRDDCIGKKFLNLLARRQLGCARLGRSRLGERILVLRMQHIVLNLVVTRKQVTTHIRTRAIRLFLADCHFFFDIADWATKATHHRATVRSL